MKTSEPSGKRISVKDKHLERHNEGDTYNKSLGRTPLYTKMNSALHRRLYK